MKSLFTSILCLICNVLFTQTYFPFPNDSAKWMVTFGSGDDGGDWGTSGYIFELQNDTLIKGNTYTNVSLVKSWMYGVLPVNDWIADDTDYNLGTVCGLREENKRIHIYEYNSITDQFEANEFFFSPIPSDTDIVIYDFNLNQGDTVEIPFYDGSPRIVNEVDSVLLADGFYHRRLYFDENDEYVQSWIEGVGSTLGLLSAFVPSGVMYYKSEFYLECVLQGETYVYGTDGCDLTEVSGINNNAINNYQLYQSGNQLTIIGNNDREAELRIYNMTGSLVLAKNLGNSQIEISINALMPDIYLLVIESAGQVVWTKKIAKPMN